MPANIGAILLIAIGVFFLLSNLDLLPMREVKAILKDWWPVLLIIVGIIQLRKK